LENKSEYTDKKIAEVSKLQSIAMIAFNKILPNLEFPEIPKLIVLM
jgi:hypothetical protein